MMSSKEPEPTGSAAFLIAAHMADVYREREYGFWVYLMSDAVIFALLFATYAAMAGRVASGPEPGGLFHLGHTFYETLCLLTSTFAFAVVRACIAARKRNSAAAWLALSFVLGLVFVMLECSEFRGMTAQGAGPTRSGALSAFFTLVGTHGLHVSAGLLWILLLGGQLFVKGLTPAVVSRLERLGMFWHFLDIVWIGIISVVYLPGMLA